MKTQSKDQRLIKKTRRKIVLMTTIIVSILFVAIDSAYSSYLVINEKNNINAVLDRVNASDNIPNVDGGTGPSDRPGINNLRVFKIRVNTTDNTYTYITGESVFSDFVTTNITTLTTNESGDIDNVYYKKVNFDNTTILVSGYDQSLEVENIRNTIILTSVAFLLGIIFIFLLSFFLTKMILKPIQEAQQKQKEFISDASHELKTPLTIIDANASILKNNNENNKWINNILNETKNMNNLIIDMISLASIEEKDTVIEEVDLSDVINNIALSFDAVCYENNVEYKTNIIENAKVNGNKKDLEKIVKILIDNAIKYVENKGIIQVTLLEEKNNYYLEVYNSGCTLKDDERDKIFERFYRDSVSRDGENKQGSGLGLAILKELCDKYKYEVTLDSKQDTYFKIIIKF